MKKTTAILAALFIFGVAIQVSAQLRRDIAVVGHNRNWSTAFVNQAPNSNFSGWAGGGASFTLATGSPQPGSYMKNKVNGGHLANCTANLVIPFAPAIADFSTAFGIAGVDLLFTGTGAFNVVCGATVLRGTFNRAILHVYAGSNSGAITLLQNTVTYVAPTNVINNAPGNFSFAAGSLSIGFTTEQPVQVTAPSGTFPGSVIPFRAFSNVTFGAVKLP